MNRRSFLSITSAIFALVALPKKLFASSARYAERFTSVVCCWLDGLKPDTYMAKIFADRDRDRIGVYKNGEDNLYVWELPLSDVEEFFKSNSSMKKTTVGCHYENFAERFTNNSLAEIEKSGEKFVVHFAENGRRNGRCEIAIKDVDFLLTRVHA
jgi:hypothetical protein